MSHKSGKKGKKSKTNPKIDSKDAHQASLAALESTLTRLAERTLAGDAQSSTDTKSDVSRDTKQDTEQQKTTPKDATSKDTTPKETMSKDTAQSVATEMAEQAPFHFRIQNLAHSLRRDIVHSKTAYSRMMDGSDDGALIDGTLTATIASDTKFSDDVLLPFDYNEGPSKVVLFINNEQRMFLRRVNPQGFFRGFEMLNYTFLKSLDDLNLSAKPSPDKKEPSVGGTKSDEASDKTSSNSDISTDLSVDPALNIRILYRWRFEEGDLINKRATRIIETPVFGEALLVAVNGYNEIVDITKEMIEALYK